MSTIVEISQWCCEHPPTGFRLVDTEQGCVVEAPSPHSPLAKYATSSYVWGARATTHLQAEKSIIGRLMQRYYLLHHDIPRTIRDAITACLSIIWLCRSLAGRRWQIYPEILGKWCPIPTLVLVLREGRNLFCRFRQEDSPIGVVESTISHCRWLWITYSPWYLNHILDLIMLPILAGIWLGGGMFPWTMPNRSQS